MRLEAKAIKFIQTIARNTNQPLYAGNSGGKDSAVLDLLLQKSGVKYISQYANTTIDPPGTIKHIRDNYPHTQILQPDISFMKLVEKKGLPTRLQRFCCEVLKEYASVGKMNFEGVRAEESKNRQNRDYIQCDTRSWQKGSQHLYAIYDWTLDDIYEYIDINNIPLAPCYSNGFDRLGCVGCPLIYSTKKRIAEFKKYPKYYQAIKRAIEKGMNANPQWKISCATDFNPDLAMSWWLSGKTIADYFPQYRFEKTKAGWQKILKYEQKELMFIDAPPLAL
jgi:phosphoadenosine phosphosulfate reductase